MDADYRPVYELDDYSKSNMSIDVTPGVGKTVAAEVLGGEQYQKIKLVGGQTGSTSVLGVNPDGSINVSVIGSLPAVITGSIAAVINASVATVQSGTARTSVISSTPSSMLVGASIFGQLPAGTATIGAVTAPAGSVLSITHPAGSVTAVSATIVAGSIMSITNPAGSVTGVRTDNASVIAIFQNSSIFAVQSGTAITSIVSITPSSVLVGASIFGQLPAGTATIGAVTAPAGSIISTTNPAGSVAAVIAQAPAGSVLTVATLAGSVMAVSGTFTTPAASIQSTTNPAGSVTAIRTDNASVITTQPAGSIMAVNATQPAGSLLSAIQVAGSVMAVRTDLASVIAITTAVGSTIAYLQAPSIVGTYAEDAAHTTADKGVFSLSVRNDTLSSVTSADGDYGAIALGPSGEAIVANSPITKWVRGNVSIMTAAGGSLIMIAAPGASIFTYLTGVQIGNFGLQSVVATIGGGLGSILGQYVVAAGAQVNPDFPNALRLGENSAVTASIGGAGATTSSVFVGVQGFIAKI